MKKITEPFIHVMGYDSWHDLFASIFVIKMKAIYLIGFSLGLLDAFINKNIFTPAAAIYVLFMLMIMDVVVGIACAIKEQRFSGAKLQRAFMRFVVQVFIVAMSYQMSLIWPVFIRQWMVDAILISFNLATLWSIIENAYSLNWIQPATYTMLKRLISIDELFKKIFNNKPKKDNE